LIKSFEEDFHVVTRSKKRSEELITSKNGSKNTFEEVVTPVIASKKGREELTFERTGMKKGNIGDVLSMASSIHPLLGCSVEVHHSPTMHAGLPVFDTFGGVPNSH
jgi:hypothetical protein